MRPERGSRFARLSIRATISGDSTADSAGKATETSKRSWSIVASRFSAELPTPLFRRAPRAKSIFGFPDCDATERVPSRDPPKTMSMTRAAELPRSWGQDHERQWA